MPTRPNLSPEPRSLAGLCLALALAAAPLPASAQSAATGQPLDLDACVRIAIDENPLLRAAQEGIGLATESVGIARAAYYPDVSLDARYRRFDTHVFLPAGLPVLNTTLGATDDWSGGFRVGYTLYDSGVRRAETSAATAGLGASRQDALRVRQDVVFAIHRAYYRVLSAEAARTAALARETRAHDHLELARTLKEAGAVPQADVLRARVEHADARLAIVKAEGGVKIAYGDLNAAMGLPASLPIAVLAAADSIPDPADQDAEAALERALARRPELEAARERVAVYEHQAAAIKGSYGPRVQADVAVGARDSEVLPEDRDWSVGLSLRLPLFSGFAKMHRVERAAIEVKIREVEVEALFNLIRQEVWAATSSLTSAVESVRQSEEIRAEAVQSLEFTRARYQAGAGTINDLLDAESTLTQADSAHVAAVLGYREAAALLLRVQGAL